MPAPLSRIISPVNDLQAANAVSDRVFATAVDPEPLADALRAERTAREAADLARWRAWLVADLPAISDDELAARWRWAFPIGGRSRADPSAPVIGRRTMRAAVDADPALREGLRRAFQRALSLLGLAEEHGGLRWRHGPLAWARGPKHDGRVYRMLRSIHNAGLSAEAVMLMSFLEREVESAEALAWYRHQVAS